MSNLIEFLEAVGADGRLSRMSAQEYAAAIEQLGLEPALREALLQRDQAAIQRLLGNGAPLMFILGAPDEAPTPDSDHDGDGEDDGDEPDFDGDKR